MGEVAAFMSEHAADSPPPFTLKGVPSSSRIDKTLRSLPEDPDAVLGVETVEPFCQALRDSAQCLVDNPRTAPPPDRAESFHYLLKMAAYAVEAGVLAADPLEPMFSAPYQIHLVDWGAASPDSCYRRTFLREDLRYRVYGRFGNADYCSFDVRQSSPQTIIIRDEIETDADGTFEFYLGGEPREGNWFALPPGSCGLTVREFFGDWSGAHRSLLRIECLDHETAPRLEHRADRVVAEYEVIGDWIRDGAVAYWVDAADRLAEHYTNTFPSALQRVGTKLPVVTTCWFDLADDDALIIELRDPESFWAFQLGTAYWSTLDYANRLTAINFVQADPSPDGVFRIVLSLQDPGVHNWLDTMGLHQGVLILRFAGATAPAAPTTRLVKLADVERELPDARRVGPAERRSQIAVRREGVSHLVCD
jgi:hypothetical protein